MIDIKISMLFFLLRVYRGDCGDGCLRCVSQQCLYCDAKNHYYLKDSSCVLSNDSNCLTVSQDGNCLICNEEFYYNQNSGKCLQVNKAFLIPHCLYYQDQYKCSQCYGHYYLLQGKCLPVQEVVDNCEVYRDSGECSYCQDGYVLSESRLECQQQTEIDHCQVYSMYQCSGCSDGYIYDSDYRLQEQWEIYMDEIMTTNTVKPLNKFCREIVSENCAVVRDYKYCQECSEGYYQSDGECKSNPQTAIVNCKVYESIRKCVQCLSGYYPSSNTVCSPNSVIDNCATFDSSSRTNKCTLCKDGHFLASSTQCSTRSNLVTNCSLYYYNSDYCQECVSNYEITTDNLACLPVVRNCLQYNVSSKETESLTCSQCSDYYYLQDNQCLQGTIANCKTYSSVSNCSECDNGYYMKNALCYSHSTVNNCLLYSQQQEDGCLQCFPGRTLFAQKNHCVYSQAIDNCDTEVNNVCSLCSDGFYLQDNECRLIDPSYNCLQRVSNLCTKCRVNYILQNGRCLKVPSFIRRFCLSDNSSETDAWSELTCRVCQESKVSMDFSDNDFCLSKNLINDYQLLINNYSTFAIEKCETVIIETQNQLLLLKCVQCKTGYFLSNDQCLQECPDNSFINVQKYSHIYECLQNANNNYGIDHCAFRTFHSDDDYKCTICKPGYVGKLLKSGRASSYNHETIVWNEQETHHFFETQYPDVECLQENDSSFFALVENCLYYSLILATDDSTLSTLYGCVQCKKGFLGRTANSGDFYYYGSCIRPNENVNCITTFIPGLDLALTQYIQCYGCFNHHQIVQQQLVIDGEEVTRIGGDFECTDEIPIENCAMSNYDMVEQRSYCIACKGGYKPAYFQTGVSALYVESCSPIDNCKNSGWFNNCSSCIEQYTNTVSIVSQIYELDFKNCSAQRDSNCALQSADGDCIVCKRDYSLVDNVCISIQSANCPVHHSYFPTNSDYLLSTFYFLQRFQGCSQCDSQYAKILFTSFFTSQNAFLNFSNRQCVSINSSISQDLFIDHCAYYTISNDCYKCAVGYILTLQGQCIKSNNTTYQNCAVANNQQCHQCQQGYVLLNNDCVRKSIDNCLTYSTSNNLLQCQQCTDYYYLSDNQCKLGTITGCLTYNTNSNECLQCLPNYMGFLNEDNVTLCFPLQNQHFKKCLQYKESAFQEQDIECEQCLDNHYFLETVYQQQCLVYYIPQNCKEIDQNILFENSTYYCTTCRDGYYNNDGTCNTRVSINNCLVYENDSQLCRECETGHFLSSNLQTCVENPTGVENCLSYYSKSLCSKCDYGYYLSSNLCLPVTTAVENCLQYSQDQSCSLCSNNYFLVDKECVLVTASNCLSYKQYNQCATCNNLYILVTNQETVDCEQIQDTKCLQNVQGNAYQCKQCQQGYYFESECVYAETQVANCLYYTSNGLCNQCEANYILSKDGTQCHSSTDYSFVDEYCEVQKFVNSYCLFCSPNYYMNDGECLKCPQNCHICYQSDQCYICKSGFNMDNNNNCLVNQSLQEEDDEPITPVNNTHLLLPLIFFIFLTQQIPLQLYSQK